MENFVSLRGAKAVALASAGDEAISCRFAQGTFSFFSWGTSISSELEKRDCFAPESSGLAMTMRLVPFVFDCLRLAAQHCTCHNPYA